MTAGTSTTGTFPETLADLINRYHDIVRSVPPRQPGWWGFVRYFYLARHDVRGRRMSLWRIEQDIRKFGDPRIHFALNCGAGSCPSIREYTAEKLDEQLDLATRSYLATGNARFDQQSRTLYLSRLFRWYRRDFGDPIAFVRHHADTELAAALGQSAPAKIAYLPWDWTPLS